MSTVLFPTFYRCAERPNISRASQKTGVNLKLFDLLKGKAGPFKKVLFISLV